LERGRFEALKLAQHNPKINLKLERTSYDGYNTRSSAKFRKSVIGETDAEKLSLHDQEKLLSRNKTVKSWMEDLGQKEAATAIPEIKGSAVVKNGKLLISTGMKVQGISFNEKERQPKTITLVTGTCFLSPKMTIGSRPVGWGCLRGITLREPGWK
jgi:hypothetical protein